MRRDQFFYDLPDELIARRPARERTGSRLLYLNAASGEVQHCRFPDLLNFLSAGDLMVFNDTRVIPARLLGSKATGGRVEVLVERLQDGNRLLAQVRASKSPKPGTRLEFDRGITATVLGRQEDFFELEFDRPPLEVLETIGHMPLPPYIDRPDDVLDKDRYQTVYAGRPGAVAAPTAGLHFDQPLLEQIAHMGVNTTFVTLHVGAGTFQPVRVENVEQHRMHSEWLNVSQEVCDAVNDTRAAGGRIICVGTTSVRCLETAARGGVLRPYAGETDIFIYPGYRFQMVDALLTNFHLPESTLLMLVSALAGRENILAAYRQAVEQHYRFFSYGDAMFIDGRVDGVA